ERAQFLERHPAVEIDLAGEVDDRHAAAADLAHDLVAPDHAHSARHGRLLGDVLRPTNVLPTREPVPSRTDAFPHQYPPARHGAVARAPAPPAAAPQCPTHRAP